jgi:hypothetical protein
MSANKSSGAPSSSMQCMTVSSRDLATILAALRFWQRTPSDYTQPENDIATDGGETPALSIEEIDALCERLNVAG